MNTLSSLYKIIPAAVFTLLMVSCDTFLDEDPKGKLAPQYYFSVRGDLDRATHALNATTVALGSSEELIAAYWAGDDITCPGNMMGNQAPFDVYYGVQANNSYMNDEWQYLFRVVKAANFIINNADRTPVDQAIKEAYLANAHYWRAFVYFHLVTIWGDLPILTADGVDYAAPVSSVDEVWTELILPDIEMAEKAPVSWRNVPNAAVESYLGENAWVTQQAAKATAAYMYLAYAGWPTNKTEYYARAAAKAKEVIDATENGTYPNGLMDKFWQNYSVEFKTGCKEALLARYFRLNSGNWCNYDVLPGDVVGITADGGASDGVGWTEVLGEIKYWKSFPEGPRKDQTYAPKTLINVDGEPTLTDWWDERRPANVQTPWFCKIIMTRQTDGNTAVYYPGEWDYTKGCTAVPGNSSIPHAMVRLAEVYCWYAEAVARSGQGDKAKAVELLNRVRNRADETQTNLYNTGMSNDELAEAAFNEHGWEIAGDFYTILAPRYFDIFRMNRLKDHFDYRKQNPDIEVAPGVFRKEVKAVPESAVWDPKNIYAPYPQGDAAINPNLK